MPTALIVEDEPEANKLLGMLVKLRGYHSAAAFDGREALDHLGRFSPDVLFLDLMLPDMSGYDVCRAVRKSRATCLVPVVVVSARIARSNRVDSFHAGADEFIAKPYTPDEIFNALDRARALRAQAELDRIEGTARFDDAEDGTTARDLARLRGLVLGRSALPEEEAAALADVIRRAETAVDDWLRAHPGGPPATLDYELTREGLALTFRGIGWLEPHERTPNDPLVADFGRFDEAIADHDADRLSLVRRWAAPGAGQ
jgi:DNA-binding response OmpR family regulator